MEKLLRFVHESTKATQINLPIDPASLPDDLASVLQGMGEINEIRDRYFRGETLAFRFPIEIKLRRGDPVLSFFMIYLKRDESLRNADEFFIRSDILVPGPAGRLKGRCVRMMLVADDDGIAQFLGDAETMFHDDWIE